MSGLTLETAVEWLPYKDEDGAMLVAMLVAYVGLYRVFLGHDGECWAWRINLLGELDTPSATVDEARGLVSGSLAKAQERAVGLARLLSKHTEEAYRERLPASDDAPDVDLVRKMASACFDSGQGIVTGETCPDGDPLVLAEETRDACIALYNAVVDIYGDDAQDMGGAYGDAFDVIGAALGQLAVVHKVLRASEHEDGIEGALSDLMLTKRGPTEGASDAGERLADLAGVDLAYYSENHGYRWGGPTAEPASVVNPEKWEVQDKVGGPGQSGRSPTPKDIDRWGEHWPTGPGCREDIERWGVYWFVDGQPACITWNGCLWLMRIGEPGGGQFMRSLHDMGGPCIQGSDPDEGLRVGDQDLRWLGRVPALGGAPTGEARRWGKRVSELAAELAAECNDKDATQARLDALIRIVEAVRASMGTEIGLGHFRAQLRAALDTAKGDA